MINMKELIKKQTNMIRRESGMNLVTEKKEVDSKTIQAISKMTQSNAHTHARIELSQALRNKRMEKAYRALYELGDYLGGYGPELAKVNTKMEKELYRQLVRNFSNYDEIYKAL